METTVVGIRDAKINLSKLLKLVQEGNEVLLTDRGRPVGKIVPVQPHSLALAERLKRLREKAEKHPITRGFVETFGASIDSITTEVD